MSESLKGIATINDVARIAGVSKRTVSRVINNSEKVNAATRAKILQVIDELDYAPSAQARGLASSRSYLLGLLFDDPNAVVIHSVQKGALKACAKYGYEMVVKPIDFRDESLIDEVLRFVRRSKLEGVIMLPPISNNDALAAAFREKGISYIRVSAKTVDEPAHMVHSQDRLAMQQVAKLFKSKKAKRAAIVVGPRDRTASIERLEGLQAALADVGLPLADSYIVQGDFTYESGLACADALLDLAEPPDAIFASNDQMAIGVIHRAQDRGVLIPKELMVVGYDDDPMSARLRPSLTSLSRPNEAMAEAAALRLMWSVSGEEEPSINEPLVFLPCLIERDSTNR